MPSKSEGKKENVTSNGIIRPPRDVISQAIKDINWVVEHTINKKIVLIGENGPTKVELLYQKIELISKSEQINKALESLGWISPNEFTQAVELAKTRIHQFVESQKREVLIAEQAIAQAIKDIKSLADRASDLKLIGDDGQRKSLFQQIMTIKNDALSKTKLPLGELESNLINAVNEAKTKIEHVATKQQERYELEILIQHMRVNDAKKVISKAISDIQAIAHTAPNVALIGENGMEGLLLEQVNSFANTEEVNKALETLGWRAPNELSNAVDEARLIIHKEVIKQQTHAATEAEEDDFSSEADWVEAIEFDKHGIDDSLNEVRKNDQGYGMLLGERIRMTLYEMEQLKTIIDDAINPKPILSSKHTNFDVNTRDIKLKIAKDNPKLKDISVDIERINGRILVKVGPCDLSGVGGHLVREQIIKDLVNQALANAKINKQYEDVNVSACIGVRGRIQMAKGFLVNNREGSGAHANAYIKTENERTLTHWEPRNGPQSFFNDTICAMVVCASTSLFEKGIRELTISTSKEATKNILKSSALKETFDHLLSVTKNRIIDLIEHLKAKFATLSSPEPEKGKGITHHFKDGLRRVIDPDLDQDEVSSNTLST